MTAVDLTESALERIENRETDLLAYAFLDRDAALAEARRIEASGLAGPLSGHVIAVKDVFDTADMPTGYGSAIYGGHRPRRDAAAVSAIRAAGGLIIGKTVTTEFAHMTAGPTRNPHNLLHTPGGSSSGSAATVAAGGATLATATQTAGSVIRPAAFCGVVGFKPSFGTISRSGLSLFGESLDTIGGFARSVAEAACFVGAMAERADLISPERAAAPRIAVWTTPDHALADDAAIAELERVAARASAAGAQVSAFETRADWQALQQAQNTIMAYEGARALAYERREKSALLSTALRLYLEEGAKISGDSYFAALKTAQAAARILLDDLQDYDVLLTLSAHGEAPLISEGTGNPHFNKVWTLLGGPALHLPSGTGPAGLPLGVQLVSGPLQDARLVAAALWLESAL
ncbi:amidase [Salipiger sp. P9]|uniref:amidase n=1 Tax=Salipiger pentaromativorans TaxID=2943193 RepID=UPI0021589D97|nr:amidase [Salipiger pentaromativorans]MCR8547394.1 amidase [Salipiger pentaromativorans]